MLWVQYGFSDGRDSDGLYIADSHVSGIAQQGRAGVWNLILLPLGRPAKPLSANRSVTTPQ
ncbi:MULTISPECIES: hypothetical protein [unclassified Neisseria]|uniref:hypothetical protein n=1 Tax=unclassified Neisseria TaxID=2623750 RepID=UPI0010724241|nr:MULTISPECIES: hypothetical protein [unclassified Neisseria]MBF0803042.1 hypothetical protein [Neisseria sp. 19428wB4_WF04]TFU44335.1 hypothetical protein E4T99_01460 [Neisseria sp. WF04]